jgi:hypothetical protein
MIVAVFLDRVVMEHRVEAFAILVKGQEEGALKFCLPIRGRVILVLLTKLVNGLNMLFEVCFVKVIRRRYKRLVPEWLHNIRFTEHEKRIWES